MNDNLLRNKGYLLKKLQYEIFDAIHEYMQDHQINQTKLADKLHVSKGYVSQIMNANFDHKLSKLVDLAIALEKVPTIRFEDFPKTGLAHNFRDTGMQHMPSENNSG